MDKIQTGLTNESPQASRIPAIVPQAEQREGNGYLKGNQSTHGRKERLKERELVEDSSICGRDCISVSTKAMVSLENETKHPNHGAKLHILKHLFCRQLIQIIPLPAQ